MTDWKYDAALVALAKNFIAEHDLTHGEFTTRLGRSFSSTRVAKYLNLDRGNAPEADAPKVEAAIRQFLRHIGRGRDFRANLFENSVTRETDAVLRQIRRTGDAGIIHGMAGHGKTCGAVLHCNANPNTIYTCARKPYACSDLALMRMLLTEYLEGSDEHYDGTSMGLWLEKRLRGSERLWIIDDAELLHMSAVKMAVSLHDATGLALAFIGNDEFVEKLRLVDQSGKLISRIGIVHHVRRGDDEAETAKKLIKQFAPDSGEELVEIVTRTLGEFGHSRRARKQLTLAANIYEGTRGAKDWEKAYAAAGSKLLQSKTSRPQAV